MNKVHLALTLLSIAIIVGPLAGIALVYRDNLAGLVLPPEVTNMASGNFAASDFQLPALASQPKYNADTGSFSVSFNFTNPLTNQISIDQLSADVKSKDNNAMLGNVALAQPINISPGENALIDVSGNLSVDAINQIKAQYAGNGNVNIILENVDAVVGGVRFHLDELDVGSIQLPG